MVDLAVQNIPQAALPWAGVCIGLQILLNPGKATTSNLAGIVHVTSRMDWYCALTEHLLDESNIELGSGSFEAIRQQLEGRVVTLYKALLLYQIKSVCSYYRNQGISFLRGLANLDDWDGDLQNVTDAESDVQDGWNQYVRVYTKEGLAEMVHRAKEMEAKLGNIYQTLQDFISLQKDTHRDDIESACRRDLRVVDPQTDMQRIEQKKDTLQDDACNWVFDTREYSAFINWDNSGTRPSSRRLLWIRGQAGAGKTMLMIGIIRKLSHQPVALAPKLSFFFCQATYKDSNNAIGVLRSLIWLLLVQQPSLSSHILQRYRDSGSQLFRDKNAWYALSEAFLDMLRDPQLSATYFAIDALDECEQGRSDLIQLILASLDVSTKVKWLVSSRPEVEIPDSIFTDNRLEIEAQRLEQPVNAYISYKLKMLEHRDGYDEETLTQIQDIVRQRSEKKFLWVALVFKNLELEEVDGWDAVKVIDRMPTGLSELYDHMMTRIERSNKDTQRRCNDVLVASVLAYRPLSLVELAIISGLADQPPKVTGRVREKTHATVKKCGSFLTITSETITVIHQSAKDYLLEKYSLMPQSAGFSQGHADVSRRSIDAMSAMLIQNPYGLSCESERKDLQPPAQDPLAPVRYSCVFWVDHLCFEGDQNFDRKPELMDDGQVFKFLGDFFLRWVESLSLLEKLSNGLQSIRKLLCVAKLQSDASRGLILFLRDAEIFLRSHGFIINRVPVQIYGCALVFTPVTNEVRRKLWKERLPFITDAQGIIDDPRIQVLEGHSRPLKAVAFSPDGETLASATDDGVIWLWNPGTGMHMKTLTGHRDSISTVAFSPDGRTLASASHDHTIKLWDIDKFMPHKTLNGIDDWVNDIAFSPNGQMIASASNGVQLWDVATGTHVTLERTEDSDSTLAVAFSPDGNTLAFEASGDIKIWDLKTGTHTRTLETHQAWFRAIAFSPINEEILALGSHGGQVEFWNVHTGLQISAVDAHYQEVYAIAFSPDGKTFASASYDSEIRLLDLDSGIYRQTLKDGGIFPVYDIAFSPDGTQIASTAGERVRLWNTVDTYGQTIERHSNGVDAIKLSPDGQIFASYSIDLTIRLWNTAKGTLKRVLEGHKSWIHAVAFSPDSKTVASASHDGTIRIWDIETGTCRHQLQSHGESFSTIAFSLDGKKLASAADIYSTWIWDADKGTHEESIEVGGLFYFYTDSIDALAFSPNDRLLATARRDCSIWLWETGTKPHTHTHTLKGHSGNIYAMAFSPNSGILASASRDQTIRLWSTVTGEQLIAFKFYVHLSGALSFKDDQYLWTNHGCLKVSSASYSPNQYEVQTPLKHGLFVEGDWITRDGDFLLWLPQDYRARDALAVYGDVVILGHDTGEVTTLYLK